MARKPNISNEHALPTCKHNISNTIATQQSKRYRSCCLNPLYSQYGPVRRLQHDARMLMIRSYRSSDRYTYHLQSDSAMSAPSPCFQIAYHNQEKLLAAVNEDGVISIIHNADGLDHKVKNKLRQSSTSENSALTTTYWTAHQNAIFDVIWTNDMRHLATGSGDLSVQIWNVETQQSTFRFQCHQMSVKCVRQVPDSDCIFASCSRDGSVLLFDTRCCTRRGPVLSLENIHSEEKYMQKSQQYASKKPSRHQRSPRSVTSLTFTQGSGGGIPYQLVTAGAADSTIKFWDLRSIYSSKHRKTLLPSKSFCCYSQMPATSPSASVPSANNRGVTSLALDSTRSKLLVSVLHGNLYLFDCRQEENHPVLDEFTGHLASSFYVKASFNQDDDLIACGSADGAIYIWDVFQSNRRSQASGKTLPYLILKGHQSEVNSVQFDSKSPYEVASCSDDGTTRIWLVDRSQQRFRPETFSLQPHSQSSITQCSKWANWDDFLEQPDGYAYTVKTTEPSQCFTNTNRKRQSFSESDDAIGLSDPSLDCDRSKKQRRNIFSTSDTISQQRTLLHFWEQTAYS